MVWHIMKTFLLSVHCFSSFLTDVVIKCPFNSTNCCTWAKFLKLFIFASFEKFMFSQCYLYYSKFLGNVHRKYDNRLPHRRISSLRRTTFLVFCLSSAILKLKIHVVPASTYIDLCSIRITRSFFSVTERRYITNITLTLPQGK